MKRGGHAFSGLSIVFFDLSPFKEEAVPGHSGLANLRAETGLRTKDPDLHLENGIIITHLFLRVGMRV